MCTEPTYGKQKGKWCLVCLTFRGGANVGFRAHLQMSALDRAESHVSMAEAIKVAFDLYLQCQGSVPEEHPISKEEVCK